MSERKVATDLAVGESYAPYSFHVTPDLNEQYCYAEEDYDSRYRQGDSGDPPLVHPALILNMSNRTRSPSFYMPEGHSVLHAKDIIEFISPAYVGKKLNVTWTVCERYKRRGRDFMVIDCRVIDEDGRDIFRRFSHNTHIKGGEA
ncbi:MAG: hypothetical protein ACKVK8_09735 [Rhodospirillales bacterium]|jgi:hypothetical protein